MLAAGGAMMATMFMRPRPAAADQPTLRLLTNWYAQAEHGGFYQARADGLYAQAGVPVSIRMGGPQVNNMQLLLGGQADIMIGSMELALLAAAKDLPVVAIGTSFQKSVTGLMVHKDITALDQLKGHPILINTEGRATFWPWLRARFGFSDAQAGVYTYNIQPFVMNPRLAIQTFVTSEPFAATQKNIPFNYLLLSDSGYRTYGNVLLATRDVIARRGDDVTRFLRASAVGWNTYLYGDATAGDRDIVIDNPSMSAAQLAYSRDALRRISALGEKGSVIGMMDDAQWAALHDLVTADGQFPDTPAWRRAYTTEFVSHLSTTVA
ncbi:ABC transporter nitrate/sulfonate/bicarbonate permease [Komagataeibacter xylinus NBRC 13693]|uniref:ABC transporter nitrate/sulfonate/bicarbonate permease n=1 Tax=Komagataeibacter xylinus NBRC 13693 TaxID=1234668 RepID=A0A0D6Q533_KOMXY|nr:MULTISPECIES: ABC transporter substrate-binding protein [Komagataeibacter]MBV0888749.1 ABC transporter substrate-binding protein [Komagataeibacter oboediens]MCK9821274.1 ABC transporter substrate-binding protein [Komagataeibacter oboediens]GAN98549.1 ABC transporter nitrate/sulfonate/bicarbonate permease [Komagataeibacter xylinus NBRC 13693]GCE79088.1 nitrate/sulfonate/bicarbonate ABC transporter periplasmic protein [Komagataeibacter oboediens]